MLTVGSEGGWAERDERTRPGGEGPRSCRTRELGLLRAPQEISMTREPLLHRRARRPLLLPSTCSSSFLLDTRRYQL